jgi:SAM-dependent methyltransferase
MTASEPETSYAGSFYAGRRELTLLSARTILGVLAEVYKARSVVDFGCGTGTWLSVAREMGAERLLGIEGQWVQDDMLDVDAIELMSQDLEIPISLGEPFDLAISLEVAEHLSPGRARSFVEDLCAAAPCVLFSAAIPHQGGRHHVNEQWQSYWTDHFLEQGYRAIDLVRPKIWTREHIPFYYRQNTILYAAAEPYRAIQERLAEQPQMVILDLVHPAQQRKLLAARPGTKESIEILLRLPMTIWTSMTRRLNA